MLIIESINKKEFQANRVKFNVTGLHKLPPHLATTLLYTVEVLTEVCVCGGEGIAVPLFPRKKKWPCSPNTKS